MLNSWGWGNERMRRAFALAWRRSFHDGSFQLAHFKVFFSFLKILFIYFQRGEGREKKGEKHQRLREKSISCLPHTPPTGDVAGNPHMCPGRESITSDLFGWKASAQSTGPHQPGYQAQLFKQLRKQYSQRWPTVIVQQVAIEGDLSGVAKMLKFVF